MKLFKWQREFFFLNAKRFNTLPAGRRTGKTRGASNSALIMAYSQDLKVLWVDVYYNNIADYYKNYFLPELEEAFPIEKNFVIEGKTKLPIYHWDAGKKILTFKGGYSKGFVKFGSSDNPKALEGASYDRIIINEMGIVIKAKPMIMKESLMPMMLESDTAQLFAVGTPKGQYTKDGEGENDYYKMHQRALQRDGDYQTMQLDCTVNPKVSLKALALMLEEYGGENTKLARQEVFGEFVEFGGDCLYPELNWYDVEIKPEDVEYKIGFIDFAGSGKDYLCFCIAYLVGTQWFIVDVYHTQEDTMVTLPNCVIKAREHGLNEVIVETNGGGAVFYNEMLKNMMEDDTIVQPMRVKGQKETRIINQKINVMKFMNFRRMKAHTEQYDKFLLHILSYETGVKNQVDDAPDAVSSLSKYVYAKFNYLYR